MSQVSIDVGKHARHTIRYKMRDMEDRCRTIRQGLGPRPIHPQTGEPTDYHSQPFRHTAEMLEMCEGLLAILESVIAPKTRP